MGEPRVCVDKLPKLPADARKRMALLEEKLWGDSRRRASPRPGQPPIPLRVGFLDGSVALQRKVARVAREWTKHAHVELLFGAEPRVAQIRISFSEDPGVSWSLVGTDALTEAKDRATMNFGWLTDRTPPADLRRVVLHEFGHALGCIHEHSQPGATIPWNPAKVYEFYRQRGWTKEDTDRNVLSRYTQAETLHTGFDARSIMLYPVSRELTDGKFEAGWNTRLSETDKAFIGRVYPRPPRS